MSKNLRSQVRGAPNVDMALNSVLATVLLILVASCDAAYENVELRFGDNTIIIPLGQPVQVTRIKNTNFEDLNLPAPDLLQLILQSRALPTLSPPPPGPTLPPDPQEAESLEETNETSLHYHANGRSCHKSHPAVTESSQDVNIPEVSKSKDGAPERDSEDDKDELNSKSNVITTTRKPSEEHIIERDTFDDRKPLYDEEILITEVQDPQDPREVKQSDASTLTTEKESISSSSATKEVTSPHPVTERIEEATQYYKPTTSSKNATDSTSTPKEDTISSDVMTYKATKHRSPTLVERITNSDEETTSNDTVTSHTTTPADDIDNIETTTKLTEKSVTSSSITYAEDTEYTPIRNTTVSHFIPEYEGDETTLEDKEDLETTRKPPVSLYLSTITTKSKRKQGKRPIEKHETDETSTTEATDSSEYHKVKNRLVPHTTNDTPASEEDSKAIVYESHSRKHSKDDETDNIENETQKDIELIDSSTLPSSYIKPTASTSPKDDSEEITTKTIKTTFSTFTTPISNLSDEDIESADSEQDTTKTTTRKQRRRRPSTLHEKDMTTEIAPTTAIVTNPATTTPPQTTTDGIRIHYTTSDELDTTTKVPIATTLAVESYAPNTSHMLDMTKKTLTTSSSPDDLDDLPEEDTDIEATRRIPSSYRRTQGPEISSVPHTTKSSPTYESPDSTEQNTAADSKTTARVQEIYRDDDETTAFVQKTMKSTTELTTTMLPERITSTETPKSSSPIAVATTKATLPLLLDKNMTSVTNTTLSPSPETTKTTPKPVRNSTTKAWRKRLQPKPKRKRIGPLKGHGKIHRRPCNKHHKKQPPGKLQKGKPGKGGRRRRRRKTTTRAPQRTTRASKAGSPTNQTSIIRNSSTKRPDTSTAKRPIRRRRTTKQPITQRSTNDASSSPAGATEANLPTPV